MDCKRGQKKSTQRRKAEIKRWRSKAVRRDSGVDYVDKLWWRWGEDKVEG